MANDKPTSGEIEAKPGTSDRRFCSVTTVIDSISKPGLLYWAAEQAALQAVDVAEFLVERIDKEGRDTVVKWLRDARFRTPEGQLSASDLGTAVHDACEKYALTGIKPAVSAEVRPFLDRFDEKVQIWQPKYEITEAAVYSPTHGYAGTLDAIATIKGQRLLLDYKSSRKSVDSDGRRSRPYSTVALQLAAYRYADFMATWPVRRFEQYRRRYYLLSTEEAKLGAPMPQVDGALAIHITPEHCDAYPTQCDASVFDYFCHTVQLFRWIDGPAKSVLGKPL
jgi:hypothetical protein